MNQRRRGPTCRGSATVPNALDLSLYPCKPHRGDYLLFLGRLQPGQGRAPGDRRRDGAGAAAEDAGQEARAEGARVLRRVRRAAPRPAGSSTSARCRTAEGRAPAERAGDALPDRVGGAVRARHDRVDGLRDARHRDPLRRGARGDRATGGAGSSSTTTARWPRRSSSADELDPMECRAYVEERFAPERMVRTTRTPTEPH